MAKTRVEQVLAYFSVSFAVLSALAGAFIIGIAFITAGQRAPYAAGLTCISSAVVLLLMALSLFRKLAAAKLAVAAPAR